MREELKQALEAKDEGAVDFRYVRTFTEDGGAGQVLMFEAAVGGRAVEGVDVITCGADRLVTEFRVLVRPMSGLVALAEAMAPRVTGPLAELARGVSGG